MLRKLIATVAVATGIGLAGAGIATASTPGAAERVTPTAGDSTVGVSTAAVWHTVGAFERLSECQAAGKAYVALGLAKAWACDNVGYWRLRILD
ncbi:hypothetical protein GCM10010372_07370 [Streptomyces tauricus]|uniref:Secreted protein n=1 Tax=Streptomyces tauricus TaxID=68274 RepID=A0ABZ1JCX7_9ACTN|nr:hypothetical protein [Streptomyces tauricus]MCW8098135.1 hypothetical protein [Streptomyces tauricus]GHA10182.1 hypothetical protein GCM10010372_07370 [Streptomyces tauricus]